MKKTDIALIVFIASFSVIVAYIIGNSIFGGITTSGVEVQVVAPISSTVGTPDPDVFNSSAINPTVSAPIDGSAALTGTQ